LKASAVREGEAIAKPAIEKGLQTAKDIASLGDDKLKDAVNIIIERIVKTNGDS
jgi:hypothetical protein